MFLLFLNFISLRFSPTKFNFVVAKYKNMAFVHRLPVREDDRLAMEDLSKVELTKRGSSDASYVRNKVLISRNFENY